MINALFGVVYHWLGGLASGSFCVPYKGVKKWSWETYWLVGGFFSWIICPWLLASLLTKDVAGLLQENQEHLAWPYLYGVLWGFGGLTFGLAVRYLGMSLGMGIAIGYCAAFGTLLPPVMGVFMKLPGVDKNIVEIAKTGSGLVILGGVAASLLGIWITALAGSAKEKEMPAEQKQKSIKEFNFKKGLLIATFSGIMSACFNFGMTAAKPIQDAAEVAGTDKLWSGLPILIVVMFGGFTTNFIWCVGLNIKNRSGYEYLSSRQRRATHGPGHDAIENPIDAPSEEVVKQSPQEKDAANDHRIPLLSNFVFSGLAGSIWYFQFFFYTMGHSKMGDYGFSSWTLHMSSIIIFSTMWGLFFKEWKGGSRKVYRLLTTGIAVLILSTVIIGVGSYIKDLENKDKPKVESSSGH